MKHLKLFENEELKKYIIFYWDEEDSLVILELDYEQKNKFMYSTSQLYSYINEKLIKEDGDSFAVMKDDSDNILYKSNNLQKCIDVIPFIYDTNKYNL